MRCHDLPIVERGIYVESQHKWQQEGLVMRLISRPRTDERGIPSFHTGYTDTCGNVESSLEHTPERIQ